MSQQAIVALEKLGFSSYEARVYIGLLRDNPITGYQLSKLSGVPRSRIYETLERLTTNGYATALLSEPAEYVPLAPDDLLSHLGQEFDNTLASLKASVEDIPSAVQSDSIWTLRSRETILAKMREMISKAQQTVYLVGWTQAVEQVKDVLETVTVRGVRTIAITCGQEFELSVTMHYRHAFEQDICRVDDNSINLVIDGSEVLVGETLPADTCQAGWSRNAGLILATEEYIRHEVYLHKIINRLGQTQEAALREAFAEGLAEIPYTL